LEVWKLEVGTALSLIMVDAGDGDDEWGLDDKGGDDFDGPQEAAPGEKGAPMSPDISYFVQQALMHSMSPSTNISPALANSLAGTAAPPTPTSSDSGSSATTKARKAAGDLILKFLCTLCNKKKPITEQVIGFSWDRECKSGYDSMYRACVAQKELDWFNEISKDPKLLSAAVKDYVTVCPPVGPGKKRTKGWTAVQCKERLISTSGIERRDKGKMMWLDEYLEFAMSVKGGYKSSHEAFKQWQDWEEDKSRPRDMESPNPEKPLRLRVVKATFVDNVSALQSEKEVEKVDRVIKNATAEDVAMLQRRVGQGHEQILGNADLSGLAYSMAQNTGASSSGVGSALPQMFHHEGTMRVDVRKQLIDKPLPDSDDEAEAEKEKRKRGTRGATEGGPQAEEAEGEGAVDANAGVEPKPKKPKFFAADRVNPGNVQAWTITTKTLTSNCEAVRIQLVKHIAEYGNPSSSGYLYYKSTVGLMQVRHKVLDMVLSTTDKDGEELKMYLSRFKTEQSSSTGKADPLAQQMKSSRSNAGPANTSAVEKSPPVQKFEDLRVIIQVHAEGEEAYQNCASQEDVTRTRNNLSAYTKAINALVSSAKGVINDINRGHRREGRSLRSWKQNWHQEARPLVNPQQFQAWLVCQYRSSKSYQIVGMRFIHTVANFLQASYLICDGLLSWRVARTGLLGEERRMALPC
jgi:hypothetical protein